MNARRRNPVVLLALLAAGVVAGACRRTYVIVPRPSGGYRPDTLRATLDGRDARVIFRFDTVTHTRTVIVTDTLWREGTRIIRDTVRLVRRDTVRIIRRDTVRVLRVDTVRVGVGFQGIRVDTVRVPGAARVDTVRIAEGGRVDTVRVPQTLVMVRVDTVRRTDTVYVQSFTQVQRRTDTLRFVRTDTVRVIRTDTVRIVRTDTVRIVRTDTVRLAGRRTLFVPPGHYPREGQCRVWIHDKAPGQQRDAAPCDALGDIPAGAFILFGGEAWDFDYDWVAAGGGAPPQIVALKRGQGRKP